MMAVICGMPTPVTTRVVQMEPGPMPTFTASAPASIRARAPSAVPTLPAMTSIWKRFLISLTVRITFRLWPWAVSTTITSTSAATRRSARSSCMTPTAAPTRRRPRASRQACAWRVKLSMSRMVMRPVRRPSASMRRSFSTRPRFRIASALAGVVSEGAVTSLSFVITSATLVSAG